MVSQEFLNQKGKLSSGCPGELGSQETIACFLTVSLVRFPRNRLRQACEWAFYLGGDLRNYV